MAAPGADAGLVRIWGPTRPVGAGFVVDDRHIVTCAHVVNASAGQPAAAVGQPESVGRVEVRVGLRWEPVEVDVLADGWVPLAADKRGDIAVLRIRGRLPAGAAVVPLRRPHRTADRRFRTQGFPDGVLFGATGLIRAGLTIGSEWVQLEDDKQPGKRLGKGFSGAPVWDTTMRAVVGMAAAEDATDPAAKVAAMLPTDVLADYWPPLAELLPSRLAPRGRRRPALVPRVAVVALLLAVAGGAVALAIQHRSGRPAGAPAGSVVSGKPATGTPPRGASISPVPPRANPIGQPYLLGSEVGFNGASGHGCRAWMNGSNPGPYVQGVIKSSGDDCEMAVWRSRNGGLTFAILSGVHRIHTGTDSTKYYWAGDIYLARVCLTDHATGESACTRAFGGASPSPITSSAST